MLFLSLWHLSVAVIYDVWAGLACCEESSSFKDEMQHIQAVLDYWIYWNVACSTSVCRKKDP